jgi:hypothetical protein
MTARHILLLALTALAGVVVASAAAGPEAATKQRVEIGMKFHAESFVLSVSRDGPLKSDSGSTAENATGAGCRYISHNGVKNPLCTEIRVLLGRRGTLTIRDALEWRDGGSPNSCGVAFGTWSVVRGTGQYEGVTGGGISGYDAHCQKWYAHHEGFLTSR